MAAALLEDREIVECAVSGRFEGEPAAAVLTNRRLLIVNERAWAPSVTVITVDPDLSVQGWQDARSATLTFFSPGRQLVVEQISEKPLAVEIAGRIRSRTGSS